MLSLVAWIACRFVVVVFELWSRLKTPSLGLSLLLMLSEFSVYCSYLPLCSRLPFSEHVFNIGGPQLRNADEEWPLPLNPYGYYPITKNQAERYGPLAERQYSSGFCPFSTSKVLQYNFSNQSLYLVVSAFCHT
jgi:hypothetical protein